MSGGGVGRAKNHDLGEETNLLMFFVLIFVAFAHIFGEWTEVNVIENIRTCIAEKLVGERYLTRRDGPLSCFFVILGRRLKVH